MSQTGTSDNPSLDVPRASRARRKRGLSLRSQLFNKTLIQSQTPSEPTNQTTNLNLFARKNDMHAQNIDQQHSSNEWEGASQQNDSKVNNSGIMPPQINIDEPVEDADFKGNSPYIILQVQLSNSTVHLTINSSRSDEARRLLYEKRKNARRNIAIKLLIKLKNRLLGINNLEPTGYGRTIPLSVNRCNLNSDFQDEYYDGHHKSLIDERNGEPYCNNVVTSAKYNAFTFLPKQLKAQFSKIANCYFMVVAIMQMIPTWSTTGQYTTIVPLLIFMSISIAREGFDDWKRHLNDKEENNKKTTVVREDEDLSNFDTHTIATIMTETLPVNNAEGNNIFLSSSSSVSDSEFTPLYTDTDLLKKYNLKEHTTRWKNVKVGDILKIKENEWFPADVVLLATSEETQEAYVETMALDGETNLKSKRPHNELSKRVSKVTGLKSTRALFTVEDPNTDLYNFEGQLTLNEETFALGPENIVYRGSILRNTKSALGIVTFTGEETKIRMNNIKNPRTKAPKLQKNINYIVIFMVCVVVLLSAFSTMAQRFLYKENKNKAWYLYEQDAGVAPTLMGFIIMYNTLIPLSLYVTMEIIKVMQLCLVQYDIDMYHVESNTPADAKTATILEELGQVSYIFSDKTGTLTDNIMIFRKFSVCGVSWLHDLDVKAGITGDDGQPKSKDDPVLHSPTKSSFQTTIQDTMNKKSSFQSALEYQPRRSTTSIARDSLDIKSFESNWRSSAFPAKSQDLQNSLALLRYIQSHPHTLFAKKAKLFLLSIALCNTCLPKRKDKSRGREDSSVYFLDDDNVKDENLEYQASSPDELALVQAARDLGFVVFNRQNSQLIIKSYPDGFEADPIMETYEVLDVIEFSSARKRMSVVVKFPDGRICIVCKGADNIILEKLRNSGLAKLKAKEISLNSSDRKTQEADAVLQTKFSHEIESRNSISSLKRSLHMRGNTEPNILASIDNYLTNNEEYEIDDIASKSRKSLHEQQAKRYSIDIVSHGDLDVSSAQVPKVKNLKKFIPNDKLLVNDEFIFEKTLEHIEEFSTEGLRTLLYAFRWVDKTEYEDWSKEYNEAKTALSDRAGRVEDVGGRIENNLELCGATAIEDKLQDGVSEAIDKLRRAGIKMWMLTGDKRETAINIGYSCRLIKDYSTVVVLSLDVGREALSQLVLSTIHDIQGGRIAHCVAVIDGATLADIESDPNLMASFIDLCVQTDSTICCRASPSQKANMVSAVRNLKKDAVTLAIGDGANDIAMIQSADIGVGITGREGLQAARSADYAVAQFRFLLKLLLVNGRYNYVRTAKFVLCTFYKELFFYLTQAIYQRNTLFSGSSMYESWSLSMFNTLFTSLPVLCVGMFDKDLKPATLLAVPELYAKGRLYQAFNLKIFISWMVLATLQSVGVSFLAYYVWGFTALEDNTTFPLGNLVFSALIIVINAKCELIEMQNRQWLAFAAFIISVGGYGLWNVLIMALYRTKDSTIYFVAYGLMTFGRDQSWWASLLLLATIPILFDILFKVFKFIFNPSDDELFKLFEKDIEMRRFFEEESYDELHQGWTFVKEESIWKRRAVLIWKAICQRFKSSSDEIANSEGIELENMPIHRKRAGTDPNPTELLPGSEGTVIYSGDTQYHESSKYDILPSGKKVRINKDGTWTKLSSKLMSKNSNKESGLADEEVDAIIEQRLNGLRNEERNSKN
ncbi:unnamed protein product [Debaryomyces tyrocola]|nr:unnamed protein product [Debaryomyces tyrocola]